ncbi:MAG: heat-inducible transcriptional repressor HrcA [Rhodospirillaceae bacterium]|nr:heat-inducible transcriptional repressor HrcA [Rhodospirillaceae bacterium]
MLDELNKRSRQVLRRLIEEYMATGLPVASRTLAKRLELPISSATVRNVMSDLEDMGLLYAPHTSSGRLPTQLGLRFFVDGLLEIGNLTDSERANIEGKCQAAGRTLDELLGEATETLSGLSRCAGLVLSPKENAPFRQVEFVSIGKGRALLVLVNESGLVENRVIEVPVGITQASLIQATNYLNSRLSGRTLDEAYIKIKEEIDAHQTEIDELSTKIVEAGLATKVEDSKKSSVLIVRGRANLLDEIQGAREIDRLRSLFEALDEKSDLKRLLESTRNAEGVQIFIGAESELFRDTDSSMVVAPYQDSKQHFVGAIGVIGPTRLNYARIIPMVDHTAGVISRILG